jgi:ATP-dependent Clp protease ATP-binding subunit ClpA
MFERFTGEARHVVVLAQEKARELAHHHIGTEHLLLALIAQERSEVRRILAGMGATTDVIEPAVLQLVPRGTTTPTGHIAFTPRAKKTLELSLRQALQRGDKVIGAEHLLLGIIAEGEGVGAKVLLRDGRTAEQIIAAIGPGSGTESTAVPSRTPAAHEVIALAEKLAGGAPLGSHHLLEALAAVDTGVAGKVLAELGVTTEAVAEQVDAIDPRTTTDNTPEQAAAASLTWDLDGDSAVLTSTHAELRDRLRALVEQAGGPLTGDGPLAGPFVAVHRALVDALTAVETALNPQPPAEEGGEPAPTTLIERLRRRRRSA